MPAQQSDSTDTKPLLQSFWGPNSSLAQQDIFDSVNTKKCSLSTVDPFKKPAQDVQQTIKTLTYSALNNKSLKAPMSL
jgi:hypothetical protein